MIVPATIRRLWAPPPALDVAAWAEQYRKLPASSAARGAAWSNDTQPALRGIMAAFTEPGVREVAVVKAAQAGGSEVLVNLLGRTVHLDPCPTLLAHPTFDSAREFVKEVLDDALRSTPELAERIRDRRTRGSALEGDSTLLLKRFPGGYIAAVGGNSPQAYARRSCRLVIADDASRFPPAVGEEGSPATLLRARTSAWPDSLCVWISTPTIEGDFIDTEWKRGDQRRYFVACPACGHQDFIEWNDRKHFRVAYGDTPESAALECPACSARHGEAARRAMLAAGEWRPTRTPDAPGLVGFHLPATLSVLGDTTLASLVAGWQAARKGGKESLRAFVNTKLGQPWVDHDAPRIEPHALLARRESYGDGIEVPEWASVLTAGVDVQADRLEVQVIAWGEHLERAVVDWTVVPGDPRRAETWEMLSDVLDTAYTHAHGALPILAAAVDAGYLAKEAVYQFAQANAHRRVYAVKGDAHPRPSEPLVLREAKRTATRPVRLWLLNTPAGKSELMAALALPPGGPSTVHFNDSLPEGYFTQLTAERLERRYVQGVAYEVWTLPEGARNEALDTFVYARAAFDILTGGRHDAFVRKNRRN